MAVRGLVPQIVKITDASGAAVSGAKAYFYTSGTSTPATVFSDTGLTTAHASPLVADADGVLPAFYFGDADSFKIDVFDASDVRVSGYPIDPIIGAQVTATAASDVSFTATADFSDTNVQDAIANSRDLPDGTAAAPTLRRSGDATTGFFFDGSGNPAISISGTLRYTFGAGELSLESGAADATLTLQAESTHDARVKLVREGASGHEIVNENGVLRIKTGSSGATDDDNIVAFSSGAWTFHSPLTGPTSTAWRLTSDQGGADTTHLTIQTDGDVLNTNNSYGALSDERLKTDIEDALEQWDDIEALRLRNYTLISTGERHLGLIAQEVQEVSPGLVTEVTPNEDGETYLAVKYSLLILKILGALQSAMIRIQALEEELSK